jgi:hypothetical protein
MNAETVHSREELIDHLFRLLDDYDGVGNQWQNRDVYTFLQAMAAWLNDCEGYYRNNGLSVDVNKPSWQMFAHALSAAAVYE